MSHLQKFSDDLTARGGNDQEGKDGDLVADFGRWCERNYLQFNIIKTKEMIVDFRRRGAPLSPVPNQEMDFEMPVSYKC